MVADLVKSDVIASIVLFNHTYAQIERTINSLLREPQIAKIVLVDNGGCGWAFSLNNPRIIVLKSNKNCGFGHGHNQAMAEFLPQCEYFLICNPDVYFNEGVVSYLLEECRCHGYKFVSPPIRYSDGSKQYSCKLLPTPLNLFLRRFMPSLAKKMDQRYEIQDADFSRNFSVPSVSGCFMLISSDLLIKLKGFDERYFMYLEDVDLCRRALDHTEIMYCSGKEIIHEFGKGSYKNTSLLMCHIKSSILYFNKWGWIFDRKRKEVNKTCLSALPVCTKK
ncbi:MULTISPECIES: glycosyltransferase [Rahnella]|jgi:GT2 family glycosyltransferase|uniref:Glycosyltransferase n=1 Tax=Rahnella sp. (strain Y9602) TaxID=2703885 RepID=A0ABW6C520_RAHSY|nr:MULTISPECIES: glycosyltransferase family 2 protein [Rahnella]AYA06629.1 glycosyltransferase family 2 protein [Rahnella aquatilis]AZP41868.1 glycosyltransferase family 2 protein [Rahnella aquatilis]AZP46209.1 glycosyltransferase family 2 protein [Rahnella aquatilis]AZP50685.1 glycosyltransferase family 2 protein [Rahnella aquatilis]MBU9864190.1 glycosyltransferase family 2 protein [Rahnella aceris]